MAKFECIVDCQYLNKYYTVIKHQGAWTPLPDLPVDNRCKHPSVFTPVGDIEKDLGVQINSLKKCPIM